MTDSAPCVQDWYSMPQHFFTDIGSKLYDWSLLAHVGYGLALPA